MKSVFIQRAIEILQEQSNIQESEFYFLLASFMIYFKSPIRNEPWNTFSENIEEGKIPFEKGILMTDEDRNPHIFKNSKVSSKMKQDLKQILFEQLIRTKKSLESKYTFHVQSVEVVLVPDIIDSSRPPTLFPKTYLQKQIQNGKYTNELTGHTFTWDIVEQIKQIKTNPSNQINFKLSSKRKKVSDSVFLDYLQKDLSKCSKVIQCCAVCKNKNTNFKSIKNYQTIPFCSLKCIEHWKY
jgi:hypothetical protein